MVTITIAVSSQARGTRHLPSVSFKGSHFQRPFSLKTVMFGALSVRGTPTFRPQQHPTLAHASSNMETSVCVCSFCLWLMASASLLPVYIVDVYSSHTYSHPPTTLITHSTHPKNTHATNTSTYLYSKVTFTQMCASSSFQVQEIS